MGKIFQSLTVSLLMATVANAELQNWYEFETEDTFLTDSSGNGRDGYLDDLEVGWVMDDVRGGVIELGGNTNGFVVADVPELSGEAFTIMTWAYRDPEFAGGAGGANDGLFQLTLATDDLEFLPPPPTAGNQKVVGAWVQKSDSAVWGRVNNEFGETSNLDRFYFMEDEEWVHFAYRGNGEEFELVINGESGEGPIIEYDGTLAEHDSVYIGRQGTETWGGRLDDFRVYSSWLSDAEILEIMEGGGGNNGVPGDFNGNEELDAADVDMLTAAIRAGGADTGFDLTDDAIVNGTDLDTWVNTLKNTYYGDANLDGEFSSADFVTMFTAGKYETGEAAGWSEGDFDGDGVFASSDFVKAFTGGGYEQGPRPQAVPEPASHALILLGTITLVLNRRK